MLLIAQGLWLVVGLDLSLDADACVSGLVGGCLSRHVDAEWALAVNKGSITSSPIFVPSIPNFSLGFVREANVIGDKGKGTALSALAVIDLGCDGGNRQLVYNPTLCRDVDLFSGEEASLCTPLSSYTPAVLGNSGYSSIE